MLLNLIILYFVLKVITGGSSDSSNSYRKYDDEEWMRWNYENR